MTDSRYRIDDTSEIISPALVLFYEILDENIAKMIEIAGDASRLRPHCKTHKMRQVAELELSRGITKHKAATFAEAEMLAEVGAKDVFLAYNLVGPNIERAVRFVQKYPDVTFLVTADHTEPIAALGRAMADAGQSIDVLLDIDTGQHRTGLEVGTQAKHMYGQIAETRGLRAGGLHVYDGQQHQTSREERQAAVDIEWDKVIDFRNELVAGNWSVPRIVAGGTPTFPIYAEKDEPTLELSPGTCVFNDAGYGGDFPDLQFAPAALLLTRVISRPTSDRVTLDLGYKAVASDPPAGRRVGVHGLEDAEQVLQNEEHLVLETARASEFKPGDELLAVPRHICPTSAMHQQAVVVRDGHVVDRWNVVARDRRLTI
jgi:D-serine deaminase-like pyridoxal phosphate-dependent protein